MKVAGVLLMGRNYLSVCVKVRGIGDVTSWDKTMIFFSVSRTLTYIVYVSDVHTELL